MDIPASLAKQMGGWEPLARTLHSFLFAVLDQQTKIPKARGPKLFYDELWFWKAILLMFGKARFLGGTKSVIAVIRENLDTLYKGGNCKKTKLGREQAANSVHKEFLRLKKPHQHLFTGAIRYAIENPVAVKDGD